MIKEFEGITFSLTEEEIKDAQILANAFRTMKKGKEHALTSTEITKRLSTIQVKAEGIRLRKLINYIRNNDLVSGLCSTSSGYFMAATQKEFYDTLKSLKDRIHNQTFTYENLFRQYKKEYVDPKSKELI